MSGPGGVMDVDGLRALAERAVYPSHAGFASVDEFLAATRATDRARRELEDALVDGGALVGLLDRVAAAEAERDALRERLAQTRPLHETERAVLMRQDDVVHEARRLSKSVGAINTTRDLDRALRRYDEAEAAMHAARVVLAAPVPSGPAEEDA